MGREEGDAPVERNVETVVERDVLVAAEAFASAQIVYWIRPVELFAELRGGIAPAHASTVDAQLGGVLFALGARYAIR